MFVAALAWWSFDEPSVAPQVLDPAPPNAQDVALITNAPQVEARVVASPPSLRGAELDGEIAWLPDGTVRIDLALRRRFDHLLSALGEVTLAQVRARFSDELAPVTTADRVNAVLAVFDRYVHYLEAAGRLQPDADPRKRLEQVHALRVATLGEEVTRAFFDDEERADLWAIERRELIARGEATPEALSKLDEQLPREARDTVEDARVLQEVVAQTAAFDEAGVSAEERRRLREAAVGPEAAARLGQLDDERAQWKARVAAFKAQRQALLPLDAEDERVLEAVLERDFTEPERRRVKALVAE